MSIFDEVHRAPTSCLLIRGIKRSIILVILVVCLRALGIIVVSRLLLVRERAEPLVTVDTGTDIALGITYGRMSDTGRGLLPVAGL